MGWIGALKAPLLCAPQCGANNGRWKLLIFKEFTKAPKCGGTLSGSGNHLLGMKVQCNAFRTYSCRFHIHISCSTVPNFHISYFIFHFLVMKVQCIPFSTYSCRFMFHSFKFPYFISMFHIPSLGDESSVQQSFNIF